MYIHAMAFPPDLPPLVGESPPFLQLMERVSLAAPQDRPVLVIGERGTGKELIAARLHHLSRRWQGSFVELNCAALPESLLESELFGHEAGAFTGAARRRIGRFELADGGTLFLDEIGNAPLPVQEKILRVIEYGTFERVGGNETISVDVRVIGATNIDLPAAAADGRFRNDLLDRLSFDVLTVPQLRHRTGDVALLALHFGRAMARELEWESFPGFAREAMTRLTKHDWPGNVRELKNTAERAVYLHGDAETPIETIILDPFESPYRPISKKKQAQPARREEGDVPRNSQISAATPLDLREAVKAFEKRLLVEALAANRHSQKDTARHLGLGYHQLRSRLKKHDLT